MSDAYREKIKTKTQMISTIENCFQKLSLRPYVLEFFNSLIGKDLNIHSVKPLPPKNVSQIEANLKRLATKVL
jgi:hypothetical protein